MREILTPPGYPRCYICRGQCRTHRYNPCFKCQGLGFLLAKQLKKRIDAVFYAQLLKDQAPIIAAIRLAKANKRALKKVQHEKYRS